MTLIVDPQLAMDMSDEEKGQLTRCESIMKEHVEGFWQAGNALLIIRDRQLYRATDKTFEEYCQRKWKFGSNYGIRLIRAADVMLNLAETLPIGTPLPKNELQVRELASLPPDKQTEVWKQSIETSADGTVTGKKVHEVARTFKPTQEPKKQPGEESREKALQAFMDDAGEVVATTTSPAEETQEIAAPPAPSPLPPSTAAPLVTPTASPSAPAVVPGKSTRRSRSHRSPR